MNFDDLGPLKHSDKLVCERCFDNQDLEKYISNLGEVGDCFFCQAANVRTLALEEFMQFVISKFSQVYGYAQDEIPIVDGEYLDEDYIVPGEDLALDIRAKQDSLYQILADFFGDRSFAGKNWGRLDLTAQLDWKWQNFCELVKYHNRFFFHTLGGGERSTDGDESAMRSSFGEFLSRLCTLINKRKLIRRVPVGYSLYRARSRPAGTCYRRAQELGPPPPKKALQFNRMNAPGIPVFYGSESKELAIAEIAEKLVSIGKFESRRELLLLDLADIPRGPSIFSEASEADRDEWAFLKKFAWEIGLTIDRNERTKLDYIPTQILTELLRDYQFAEGKIDGIKYRSATEKDGKNVVLFANSADVADLHSNAEPYDEPDSDSYRSYTGSTAWLFLTDSWEEEIFS